MSRIAILAVLILAVPAAANEALDDAYAKDVLIIVSEHHSCYRFDIYLALTPQQHGRGLMHVRELPEMTGMLFVYPTERIIGMYMKNTYIPLDMFFVRSDGTVSSIARNTEPLSLRTIPSAEPVRFVLELNAGVAEKLGIDENSRLIWEPDNE